MSHCLFEHSILGHLGYVLLFIILHAKHFCGQIFACASVCPLQRVLYY